MMARARPDLEVQEHWLKPVTRDNKRLREQNMTTNPGENSDNYDHDHEVLKYNDDSAHDYDEMGRYALMSEAQKSC